jgi:hypothetical protein
LLAAALLASSCYSSADSARPAGKPPEKSTEASRATTGPVGPNGGSVDRLDFVVFGDVRASSPNADSTYPKAVFTSIMQQANSTSAQFAVGTGDYMFSNTQASVSNQVGQLLQAEQSFKKFIFHDMGNHECTGFTASNCPNGTETPNMQAFMLQLVPFSQLPYYSFDVQTGAGVAKFVFIAANAWDSAQESWLTQELARKTTYTFVVRHEPPHNATAPGAGPSDAIIAAAQVTMALYGHTHVYRHLSANAVISGNAGAPLEGGHFGFLHVTQLQDGNIQAQEIQQGSGAVVDTFTVTPAGAAAQ